MIILRRRRDLVVETGLIVMLACACGQGSRAVDATGLPLVRLAIAPTIPTPRVVPLDGPRRSLIADFELHGDTLDLLDLVTHEVTEYRHHDGTWSFTRVVARPTPNLPQLRTATGMTRTGDSLILVGADATVQILDRDGRLLRVVRADLGCDPLRPSIVSLGNDDLLIAGACLDDDHVLREILWRGGFDGHFTRIATDLRFAADGTTGYLFAATRSLTATASGALFGVGTTNCLWQLTAQRGLPRRRCPLARVAYRASDPRGVVRSALAEFQRRHRVSGFAFEWHEQLPLYVDRLLLDTTIVLVRRAAPETLVVVPADAAANDPPLMTGPSGTFVGCKRDACLWFQPMAPTLAGHGVAIVTADSLAALLQARRHAHR